MKTLRDMRESEPIDVHIQTSGKGINIIPIWKYDTDAFTFLADGVTIKGYDTAFSSNTSHNIDIPINSRSAYIANASKL